MIKFRLYYDKDKETLWLNEMADQGYAMTGFFAGFYTFEKCEPGEYRYQVDFSEKPFGISKNYRDFMEEMNIEIVEKWFFWIILRKKAADGEFQLYTDVDSSISHYKKIRMMFKIAVIIETTCFIMECMAVAALDRLWPTVFAFILAIIIISMLRTVTSINKVIAGLKERKGELSGNCADGSSGPSPLLSAGLLLNVCVLLIDDGIPHELKITIQIAAIIFMLIGIYRTRYVFRDN